VIDLLARPNLPAEAADAVDFLRVVASVDLPPHAVADAVSGWRVLLPHIDAFADHSNGQPVAADEDTVTVLDRALVFLRQQRNLAAGIRIAAYRLAVNEQLHGPDHQITLTSRNSLAFAYYPLRLTARTGLRWDGTADHLAKLGWEGWV